MSSNSAFSGRPLPKIDRTMIWSKHVPTGVSDTVRTNIIDHVSPSAPILSNAGERRYFVEASDDELDAVMHSRLTLTKSNFKMFNDEFMSKDDDGREEYMLREMQALLRHGERVDFLRNLELMNEPGEYNLNTQILRRISEVEEIYKSAGRELPLQINLDLVDLSEQQVLTDVYGFGIDEVASAKATFPGRLLTKPTERDVESSAPKWSEDYATEDELLDAASIYTHADPGFTVLSNSRIFSAKSQGEFDRNMLEYVTNNEQAYRTFDEKFVRAGDHERHDYMLRGAQAFPKRRDQEMYFDRVKILVTPGHEHNVDNLIGKKIDGVENMYKQQGRDVPEDIHAKLYDMDSFRVIDMSMEDHIARSMDSRAPESDATDKIKTPEPKIDFHALQETLRESMGSSAPKGNDGPSLV